MSANDTFSDVKAFATRLVDLRKARRKRVLEGRQVSIRRTTLNPSQRTEVLAKTGGRCHICGGEIFDTEWQADHVLAHSTGGLHSTDNYLPAHSLCNNYRWHYSAEEFQWIIKIGVWLRTHIEKQTAIGRTVAQRFCDYDKKRAGRRKSANHKTGGQINRR